MFKENEKPCVQALVRPRRQKEACPVSAAHLADTCPRISVLWALLICSRGGPGCCERRGCLMVSALDSGASAPGSSPGRGHCVVFLGKTLNSHGASLHPGV